jgi:hypothetical protein
MAPLRATHVLPSCFARTSQLKKLETELGTEKTNTIESKRLQGSACKRLADLMTSFHIQKEESFEQVHQQQMVPDMLVRAPSRI